MAFEKAVAVYTAKFAIGTVPQAAALVGLIAWRRKRSSSGRSSRFGSMIPRAVSPRRSACAVEQDAALSMNEAVATSLRGANASGPSGRPDDKLGDEAIPHPDHKTGLLRLARNDDVQ